MKTNTVHPPQQTILREFISECCGTALLLCGVVGSGIMGENLSAGNTALALLANSMATGTLLFALILVFAPLSGAHFNPAVTLSLMITKKIKPQDAFWRIVAQIGGAFLGVASAHFMFALPIFSISEHIRTGESQWLSEFLATFGLLLVIHGCQRYSTPVIALAIGAYITGAYWFTSSTSFANPAVTMARSFTNTFAGIHPSGILAFIVAQVLGAMTATVFFNWLNPETHK